MSYPNSDDKLIKKQLLLDTITKRSATSADPTLQAIHSALNAGENSKLEAKVLSGGYTNYSYKVSIDNQPDLCIFAKICFEYALWNPDPSAYYDLKRTESEYEIMSKVSPHAGDCVVAPIGCWDIAHEGQNMKLLVTEWARGDEQAVNQFFEGSVDPRIASKIAHTLATLHTLTDFDLNFNEQVKGCMLNLIDNGMNTAIEKSKKRTSEDCVEEYVQRLGEEYVTKLFQSGVSDYHAKDCLIHGDSHMMNILLEARPSADDLDKFGPDGSVTLCDWEMAYVGPIGKDIGLALIVPLSCMVIQALNGQRDAVENIAAFNKSLIDTYMDRMEEAGKSEEELATIMRKIVGWVGMRGYLVWYILQLKLDGLEVTEEQSKYLNENLGLLALKSVQLAYDTKEFIGKDSVSAADVRAKFDSLVEDELARAYRLFENSNTKVQHRRKSSLLRTADRRISDASMLHLAMEEVRTLSSSGHSRRLSCSVEEKLPTSAIEA